LGFFKIFFYDEKVSTSFSDHVAQNETVNETLESLRIPTILMETMITVGNKIDLVRLGHFEND
jgi:hypothetical protein